MKKDDKNKYLYDIYSNDSKLIDKKFKFWLFFANPTTEVKPLFNNYPVLTFKCKVKEVSHKNNSQPNFEYEIGKPAY